MISFLKASALCTHEFDSKSNNVNFPVVFLVPTTCNWPLNFALHHSLLIAKCNLLPLNICKTKKATSLWKSKIWIADMLKAANNEYSVLTPLLII